LAGRWKVTVDASAKLKKSIVMTKGSNRNPWQGHWLAPLRVAFGQWAKVAIRGWFVTCLAWPGMAWSELAVCVSK